MHVELAQGRRHDILSRLERGAAALLRRYPATFHNERPMASFAFDDVPRSAAQAGSDTLLDEGVHGTFYLGGGLIDNRSDNFVFSQMSDVTKLLDDGHEIGCHGYSHTDMQLLSGNQVREEIRKNREFFQRIDPRVSLENYAYPYGSTGWVQKGILARNFDSCRGVRGGINASGADLAQLFANTVYGPDADKAALDRLLQATIRQNGWIIFYTHDVAEDPTPWGCSPAHLRDAVRFVKAAGLEVMTVRGALRAAKVSLRNLTSSEGEDVSGVRW